MRLKIVKFAFWLQDLADNMLERFDTCCYPGCQKQADHWCITGGHRHCYEHESGFYSDVEFCQICYDSMTHPRKKRGKSKNAKRILPMTQPKPDGAQEEKWVSVSERKPEIVREWKYGPHSYGESALVLMWTGHIQLTGFYFKSGTWAEFYGQTVKPTHWRPLPEPPGDIAAEIEREGMNAGR